MKTMEQKLSEAEQSHSEGLLDEAEKQYLSILNEDPTNVRVRHNCALIRFQKGQKDKAIFELERLKKEVPSFSNSYFSLANAYRNIGQNQLSSHNYLSGFECRFSYASDSGDITARVKKLIDAILKVDIFVLQQNIQTLTEFGSFLSVQGVYSRENASLLDYSYKALSQCQDVEVYYTFRLMSLLSFLHFKKVGSIDWNDHIVSRICIPLFDDCLNKEYFDTQLTLESEIYNGYVKQVETEAHFKSSISKWTDIMRRSGRRLNELTSLPVKNRVQNNAPYKIGFFIHVASTLAHINVLLNYLEGLKLSGEKRIKPTVYILNGVSPKLEAMLEQLEVERHYLGNYLEKGKDSTRNKLIVLKQLSHKNDLDAIVWISLATMMSFAFNFKLAPVHIWWSMKYHSLSFSEVDAYIGLGAFEKTRIIDGHSWRIGKTIYSTGFQDPSHKDVEEARAKFSRHDVLLGCFGREEKIDNEQFLSSVATILRENKNVGFLWTGRVELKRITSYLESHGVIDQCHFIGWVDTKLYARVIDIFIDSFPFPCTTTAIDAMLASKPLVLFRSPEAFETGIPMLVDPVVRGLAGEKEEIEDVQRLFGINSERSYYLLSGKVEEYIENVQQLIDDKEYRANVGAAYQEFANRYLTSKEKMAESFSQHFVEILEAAGS